MRWKSAPPILLAPSSRSGSAALKLPGASAFPPLDEHLVEPEGRDERVRGESLVAQPALAPHADRHFGLDYVLGAHLRPGFIGATDLLTRLSHGSDFATDTCIRKEGTDPTTGQRYLEELAFEVVHEQPLAKLVVRAEELSARGVRRIFALFVKRREVQEWAPGARAFRLLEPESAIEDPCLSRPLLVRALVDAAAADDEVARALEAKNTPAIVAMKAASEERGEERGEARGELREARAAVLAVLAGRGLAVPERVRAKIEASNDVAALRRFLTRAITAENAEEIFDEP